MVKLAYKIKTIMAHNHTNKSGLSLAFWLNLLFSLIEVAGGIFTNSTAIIADAFHDFMDAIAIGVAILLEKISGKKRTPKFSYGYKRFSLLAALGMSLFLIFGAAGMIISAINSLAEPKEVNSLGMLWLALLGVAINGFAFLRIKNGGSPQHHHGHHHAHQHNHSHNHNSSAIMLHLLEDVLGWVAVFIGAVIIYFTGWHWIDGILTLMIAVFIGFNAIKNLVGTLKVLLQAVPDLINIDNLTRELRQMNSINHIHDVHVWSLDGSYNVASLHAVIDENTKTHQNTIITAIVELMKTHHIQHTTVQIEKGTSNCTLLHC
jgi:cobalt-zinc-cadmium efflux system protein